MNRAELNKAHTKIFEAATDVYSLIGPGLPYNLYRACLMHELRLKGLMYKKDVIFPVMYKDYKVSELAIEILVENNIIIELLTDNEILPFHVASMQSKLKITGLRLGIIITFNSLNIIDGYRKIMINQ